MLAVTGFMCFLQGLFDVTGSMWLLQGLRGCYGIHVPLLSPPPRKSPCVALSGCCRVYVAVTGPTFRSCPPENRLAWLLRDGFTCRCWQLRDLYASCRVYVMLLGLCGCCGMVYVTVGVNAALALCMWRAATNIHSDEGKRIMASGR